MSKKGASRYLVLGVDYAGEICLKLLKAVPGNHRTSGVVEAPQSLFFRLSYFLNIGKHVTVLRWVTKNGVTIKDRGYDVRSLPTVSFC